MTQYRKPFPHTVIDGYISAETVRQINAEWPDDWQKESGTATIKWHTRLLPPSARAVVDDIDIDQLERLTGISGLFADPDLFGGGLHCIPKGGFLKQHIDFNCHPKGWSRRVNLLIYLNRHWSDDWGGHLMLGENCEKAVSPKGGRAVIFETNDLSWHGHPKRLACPESVQRRSLALYFYTAEPPAREAHTTIYQRKRP